MQGSNLTQTTPGRGTAQDAVTAAVSEDAASTGTLAAVFVDRQTNSTNYDCMHIADHRPVSLRSSNANRLQQTYHIIMRYVACTTTITAPLQRNSARSHQLSRGYEK